MLATFACHACGFEFTYRRSDKPGNARRFCDDCRAERKRLEYQRRYTRLRDRLDTERTVTLDDHHPIRPLLAAFVDHQCLLRLALAAVRTGRYALAEQLLAGELGEDRRTA